MRKARASITLKSATPAHAKKVHALIAANLEEGRLLPREIGELTIHADRFVIALRGRAIVGCAELAPLSGQVAEVRSLAVDRSARGLRIGTLLVEELRRRARREGYDKLCAFTHAPAYFAHLGFSIVPHEWLLEKIFTDCVKCPQFRKCGQYAMEVPLDECRERVQEPAYAADADDQAGAAAPHQAA